MITTPCSRRLLCRTGRPRTRDQSPLAGRVALSTRTSESDAVFLVGTQSVDGRRCRRTRMSFYADVVLPRLCHLAMRNRRLVPYHERVIGAAEGRVLEIGIGSGVNLPFYRSQVLELLGLEPVPRLVAMARGAASGAAVPVNLIE